MPEKGEINVLGDLWKADMGKILKEKFIDIDPEKEKFGFLPKMATASKGSIGALLASGFAERIISAGNQLCTKVNSLLSPEEINMCVVLRMNRKFMAFMRKHHADLF